MEKPMTLDVELLQIEELEGRFEMSPATALLLADGCCTCDCHITVKLP